MAVLTTTTQKRNAWIAWLDHCSGRNGVYINHLFFGKTIGGVPQPWTQAVIALEIVHRATGYTPKSAWAYNFRGISGAVCTCSNYGSCSLHGNGIAIDIDPTLNPYKRTSIFRWSDTKYTPEQIAAIEAIKNTKGEQIWFWGGRWKSIKDYMHFEANVDPGSTAVNWSTVKGYAGTEEQVMKRGDKNAMVAEVQHALKKFWNYDIGTWTPWAGKSNLDPGHTFGPGEDGDFGAGTETLVKTFQKAFSLPQTGIVDGVVAAAIFCRYGGASVDTNQFVTKTVFNAHKHDEGQTGQPL